jgi:integrase
MKVSAVRLSDSYVAELKPGLKKMDVWDSGCRGFGCEILPSGSKLLVVKTCITVKVGPKRIQRRQWHTLGKWPAVNVEDARAQAEALKLRVRKGEDPKAIAQRERAEALAEAAKRAARPTVGELCDEFTKEHIKAEVTRANGRIKVHRIGSPKEGNKESTAKEHVRMIEKFIRPVLGKLIVEEVGTAEIARMLRRIREKTPTQANRVRSLLGVMFKKAALWGYRPAGSNPVPDQERTSEIARERNLTDLEIRALGAALRNAEKIEDGLDPAFPHPPLAAVRLALLTGMRKGEILALRWEWINLEAGEIVIPPAFHKSGRKSGRVRLVRLCAAACDLLGKLSNVSRLRGTQIFASPQQNRNLMDLQDPWERVRKAAGLNDEDPEKQVHFHDLRRTYASVAARMGYPELWIGALLGHAAGTVTQGYARVGGDPLREAVEAIGGRIAGLLDGTIGPLKEAEERAKAQGAKKA